MSILDFSKAFDRVPHQYLLKKIHQLRNQRYCSKTCVKRPLSKRPQIGFQYQLLLNASQKYCRMLQGEHSAILSTFIKLPYVIKIFVLSIFEWPFTQILLYPPSIRCHSSLAPGHSKFLYKANHQKNYLLSVECHKAQS